MEAVEAVEAGRLTSIVSMTIALPYLLLARPRASWSLSESRGGSTSHLEVAVEAEGVVAVEAEGVVEALEGGEEVAEAEEDAERNSFVPRLI